MQAELAVVVVVDARVDAGGGRAKVVEAWRRRRGGRVSGGGEVGGDDAGNW